MKRSLLAVLWMALLILARHLPALAQSSGPLILSKDATGPITRISLSLSLQANAVCDQTQSLIPNESRLVADDFSMVVDNTGIGTFRGFAKIVTPEGQTVLTGLLQGTVGLTAHRDPGKDCRAPGHLEGMLEEIRIFSPPLASTDAAPDGTVPAYPVPAERMPAASDSVIVSGVPRRSVGLAWTVNFSADLIQESASPLPLYRARLDGLVIPPPVPIEDKVKILSDRSEYGVNDPITALIVNGSDQAIEVFDEQSYCAIVQLQRQEVDQWMLLAGCPLARVPIPTIIGPGETKKVVLPPDPNTPANKQPGIHRLALTFTVLDANKMPIGNPVTITSLLFRVGEPPTNGNITLTTSQSTYRIDDRIMATIKNDSDQSIQAPDHLSYCTMLLLQRQTGDNWVPVAPCLLLTPTRLITIGTHKSVSIALPPEPAIGHYDPGTYRVEMVFVFLDSGGRPTGLPVVLDSSPFTVITN